MNQCDGCRRGLRLEKSPYSLGEIHRGEGYDMQMCTRDRYVGDATGDANDIPSILELQLRESVSRTKRPIEEFDEQYQREAVQRVKKLLADTKQMVVQAEALVASLRSPYDYYAKNQK